MLVSLKYRCRCPPVWSFHIPLPETPCTCLRTSISWFSGWLVTDIMKNCALNKHVIQHLPTIWYCSEGKIFCVKFSLQSPSVDVKLCMWGQTASSLSGSAGIVFIDCICIRRRNGKLDVGVERWVGRSPLTPLTVLPRPQCHRHLGEEKIGKKRDIRQKLGPPPPGGLS